MSVSGADMGDTSGALARAYAATGTNPQTQPGTIVLMREGCSCFPPQQAMDEMTVMQLAQTQSPFNRFRQGLTLVHFSAQR
jgi:hypothetical protein